MFGSITSRMYLSVMMPPCGRMPSATSPATRAIASPTTARNDFRPRIVDRTRIEVRRHQRVLVRLAEKLRLRAVLPAVPHRLHHLDVFLHPRRRRAPRAAEAALVVALHLAAEADR